MVEIMYFSAKWCGPCKAMQPVLASLVADGIKVTKVDIDQEPALSRQYGIMAVPTTILLKDGQSVNKIVGARDKSTLLAAINAVSLA